MRPIVARAAPSRCVWPAFGPQALLPATAAVARLWRPTDARRALFAGVAAHAFHPFHRPADRGGRADDHRRRPPPRLAGRRRRLTGDHRRPRGAADGARRAGSRPGCGCAPPADLPAGRRRPARPRARRGRRHPRATGCRRGSRGPTAGSATGPARSRSTSRSRAACRGPTRPAAGPAPSTSAARSRRSPTPSATIHAGRMPARPFVLVGQQYLADPTRSKGDLHPVWTYAHVPHGYDGDATEAILGQIERFAPGVPRADRRHGRPHRRPQFEDVQPELRRRRHRHRGEHHPPAGHAPPRRPRPVQHRDPRRCTSARRRPHRAPAPTACAATTPPTRRSAT